MSVKVKSMIVIADDLTGANDTGVQFANRGLHTEIILEGTLLPVTSENIIMAVDANSRAIPAAKAYSRVRKIASRHSVLVFSTTIRRLILRYAGMLG